MHVERENAHKDKPPKILTADEKIVQWFMRDIDYPDWFRGLSHFQMDAADSLLNSIRDDSEQGTSHRVREVLIKLGIEPIVSCQKIKLAMRISRGNDMAFLWFFMELYYRHRCSDCEHKTVGGYTINEQLIMTVIAHLDTISTLRELDKMLPKQPPQPKKPKIRKKKKAKWHGLPYFERQTRPIPYGNSLSLKEADNVPNFMDYDEYLNPNFIVANECNRWYATYTLDKQRKESKRIVKDQLIDIVKKTKITDEPNKNGSVTENDDPEKGSKNPNVCSYHEAMEVIKEKIASDLLVAKKEACEKYFDIEGNLKDVS